MAAAGRAGEAPWQTLDQIVVACAADIPTLASITAAAPRADFRVAGEKVPREPHRYSGRTAMRADVTVHEPKPADDRDSSLAFSMEGRHGPVVPGALIPYFWAPGWNSVQSLNKFQQEVAGPLAGGDAGVRLLEPGEPAGASFLGGIPTAFAPRPEAPVCAPE